MLHNIFDVDYELSFRRAMLVKRMLILKNCSYPICPRCGISLDREYVRFCDRCGQLLDWINYDDAEAEYKIV